MTDNIDNLIVGQFEVRKRHEDELNELQKKVALGLGTPAVKRDIVLIKAKIKEVDTAIDDLNKSRKEFQTATTEEALELTLNEEKEIINKLITHHNIGYITEQNKFVYCMGMQEDNSDVVNPIFKLVEANRFGRVLGKMARSIKKPLNKFNFRSFQEELIDYFQATNNDYYDITCSFHNQKWGKEKVYNKLSVIRKFWVQPDYDNAKDYDRRFDFLLSCVGGGKQENIDHLEQWLTYKWMYPERIANTPNLDIGGSPGGNGKGRYAELSKTIFTNPCIIVAALKELMDGFNGTWDMATILLYDEPAQNELPEGKLKQATGGEDMRSERKGIDAQIVDRNYNILFLSNNPNGVVKLAGTGMGGEDRRYSVLITDKVMLDEATDSGMSLDEASAFVNSINDLVKNRKEVAKWLAHIILKHDVKNMATLRALHGEDYQQRFEDQKTNIDAAFDQILPIYKKNGCIPSKVLWELTIALTGSEKLKQNGCGKLWKKYCLRKKVVCNQYKPRLIHTFEGDEIFEQSSASLFAIDELHRCFDHGDITEKKPGKHTVYSSTNIKIAAVLDENNNDADAAALLTNERDAMFEQSAASESKKLFEMLKKHPKH